MNEAKYIGQRGKTIQKFVKFWLPNDLSFSRVSSFSNTINESLADDSAFYFNIAKVDE